MTPGINLKALSNPRAPSYLKSRLLVYVSVGYIEARMHYLRNGNNGERYHYFSVGLVGLQRSRSDLKVGIPLNAAKGSCN